MPKYSKNSEVDSRLWKWKSWVNTENNRRIIEKYLLCLYETAKNWNNSTIRQVEFQREQV